MTLAEVETFRRRVRDLRKEYEHNLEQIERDFARLKGIPWEDVKGSGREIALEIHARTYIIDPMLRGLGWDVTDPTKMLVEDRVKPDAVKAEGNRRYLDYHGRVNAEGRSLVIVEAKRPSFDLPEPDRGSISNLIGIRLHAISADDPKGEPLSGKWEDLLKTLIDYVKRSKNEFGHAPARVVITNGEWYIVFKDVEATLLSENPNPDNIIVFKDLGDVESEAKKFYCLLNYRSLSGHIPPQHPSSLPEFILEGEEALCAQVVDVCVCPPRSEATLNFC